MLFSVQEWKDSKSLRNRPQTLTHKCAHTLIPGPMDAVFCGLTNETAQTNLFMGNCPFPYSLLESKTHFPRWLWLWPNTIDPQKDDTFILGQSQMSIVSPWVSDWSVETMAKLTCFQKTFIFPLINVNPCKPLFVANICSTLFNLLNTKHVLSKINKYTHYPLVI